MRLASVMILLFKWKWTLFFIFVRFFSWAKKGRKFRGEPLKRERSRLYLLCQGEKGPSNKNNSCKVDMFSSSNLFKLWQISSIFFTLEKNSHRKFRFLEDKSYMCTYLFISNWKTGKRANKASQKVQNICKKRSGRIKIQYLNQWWFEDRSGLAIVWEMQKCVYH